MNKINITIVFLTLLCLTLLASATCDGPPDQCQVELINVTHRIHSGDEIDIFVKFRNAGTETCCYQAQLFNMHDRLNYIEKEPDIFWKWVRPGESATITLTSNWDWEWDVCTLHGTSPGKGNFSIDIIGIDTPALISTPIECIAPSGDDCLFKNIVKSYVFDTPPSCCGPFEGTSCLGYNKSYGGFTCDESVQINYNVSCLVECEYDPRINNCSCILRDTCAIKCLQGRESRCLYGDFICAGPHYRCANGDEPEVKCSTTKNCKYQCAAECGKRTTCTRDCEVCCNSGANCGKLLPYPYTKEEFDVCMEACIGLCRANEELCNIIYILGGIAVAVSVFLIMVHGIRWMTADDFEGRQDAKRGIVYVFIGLILVMVAASLASYFFTGSLVC